jgi:hypothetical protein
MELQSVYPAAWHRDLVSVARRHALSITNDTELRGIQLQGCRRDGCLDHGLSCPCLHVQRTTSDVCLCDNDRDDNHRVRDELPETTTGHRHPFHEACLHFDA